MNLPIHQLLPKQAAPSHPLVCCRAAAGLHKLNFAPDYIVFINDVYFCWSDVVRLMNYGADITCGTDWWQNMGKWVVCKLKHKL